MWRRMMVLGVASLLAMQGALGAETATAVIAPQSTIVSSIKPVAWLVAELAPQQVAQQTVVPAGFSPHEYQLRPQDAAAISSADVVVWVGPAMEPWLVPQVAKLPAERQLALLPQLRSHDHAEHAADDHDHGHAAHEHVHVLETDPHFWLDPLAMKEAAVQLAYTLGVRYPQHKAEVQAKLAVFQQRLDKLDEELSRGFAPVNEVGFAVYHDAYSHLVARYQLNQVAAIWRHESVPPGAKARAILLKQLVDGEVVCLFYEPEHGRDQADKWLGKNRLRYVELDLLGQYSPGYEAFMRDISAKMIGCLAQAKPSSK